MIVHGSWRNKVVSSCLQEERDKKDFNGTLAEIGSAKDFSAL